MDAQLSNKIDRLLELLEPKEKKKTKSFDANEAFERIRLKHLRKQIKGK